MYKYTWVEKLKYNIQGFVEILVLIILAATVPLGYILSTLGIISFI